MPEEEQGKREERSGTGGPGLGGTQEGIERSGPPVGMSGGDISLTKGRVDSERDGESDDERSAPTRPAEE